MKDGVGKWRAAGGLVPAILFPVALVLAVSLLLNGCGGRQEAGTGNADAGAGEVVIWSYYETKQQKEGLDRLVEGFNNRQKDYVARWEYQGPSSEFKKLLSIGVAEGSLPDVVIIDNPDMRKYVELGIFEDITRTVEADYDLTEFYPEVISSVRYDGRYYGVPFCCNNVGLVYNKDMFREAGMEPPGNWEQFLHAAEVMTTKERYGFAMSAILEEQSSFQLAPWLLSTGEDMEDLGGEGTVEALSMIKEMVDKGYMPRDCINWSQVDVARQFAAGKCAMMENGPWALPLVEEAGIDYGVVTLPVDERSIVVTGGENFGIIKGKNVDGAMALLAYYYEDDVMLRLNEQMYALPPVRRLAVRLQESNPAYQVFAQQMEHCITRSAYLYWPKITGVLSESLYGVIVGGTSPEEAADDIRDRIQACMQE
ncbi:sugar ABC transporter substrate-binding protein [Clostridiales bacterium TF09-2AC]|nr:sugar ABC transporter substrate-binding protein [Clostridiales bacterium TF09-2AC]